MHSVRQFELLRALARHRHFGRAAAELGVSQPALTRSLQHIEDDLGVRLFDRDGAVAPTLFGEILIARGDTVITAFADAMREIALVKGLSVGELAVAAGPYPAAISVEEAIGRLSADNPGLSLHLAIQDWTGVIAAVQAGTVDIGIADISEVASQPDLVAEPIRRSPMGFFCRAGHPLLAQNSLTIGHLAAYPWVGPSLPAPILAQLPPGPAPFGVQDGPDGRWRCRIRVETFPGMRNIVLASDALGVALSAQIARDCDDGRLAFVPVDVPWMQLNYGFITRRGRSPSPAAQAFRTCVLAVEAGIRPLPQSDRSPTTGAEP
jgi:hypothetical protein